MADWFYSWFFAPKEPQDTGLQAEMEAYFEEHKVHRRADRVLPVPMEDSDAAHEEAETLLYRARFSHHDVVCFADFLLSNRWMLDPENTVRYKSAMISFAMNRDIWLRLHYRELFRNADLDTDVGRAA
jgi:hypothetical protein